MYRKFFRLLLVASVAAGFSLAPMLTGPAYADSGVDVYNVPRGFDSGSVTPHETKIRIGDIVTWYIREGKHNITPANDVADGQKWVEKGSGDLSVGDPDYVAKNFTKAGKYYYFSSTNGEGKDDHGNLSGMYGHILVVDPNAPPPPPPPDTTTTTQPPTDQPAAQPTPTTTPTTAPAAVGPAAAHTPPPAAPAPTTTTAAKADKNKNPKDSSTTTSTTVPPPGLINLPDSAIIPLLPSSATVQDGAIAEPGSVPEGDAVALIKKKHSHKGMLVLVATGLGIGALGVGAAGYKFAHRSSKYFPA